MKLCFFGISGIPLGKHNVKDPRLDQADKLVEATKKTYVQVDVVGAEEVLHADAVAVSHESRPDLILRDLELVETRLGREPPAQERAALLKIQACLEQEHFIRNDGLEVADLQAVAAHAFCTAKPVVVAEPRELAAFDEFLVRLLRESGYLSYLTVGGKENRAWLIKQGATAVEAAGVIHTDIQKGFIRAEVISFHDFLQAGGETAAKRAGKLRLETKTYVVQDYDLMNFRFHK
jgi:hypothetical protein